MNSHYDVLGVPFDADADEIRRAYLRKAQLLHPDRHGGSPESVRRQAEAEMKAVNEAWKTLKDPEARSRYDMECSWGGGGPQAGPPSRPSWGVGGGRAAPRRGGGEGRQRGVEGAEGP